MFARWFFVRLSAAEKALDQGRIDDAYAVAAQPEFRRDERGENLLDRLVAPLLARARLHRQAGRLSDALADLDKLAAIGRDGPDVQTLRQRVVEQMRQGGADAAEQQAAYARAAENVRAGRLETGRLDVQRIDDTRRRADLEEELQQRVARGTERIQQASEALDRNELLVAIRYWNEARERFGRTAQTENLASRLAAAAQRSVADWHRDGKLERLMAARDGIGALAAHDPALAECQRLINFCSRATGQLAAADFDALRRTLLRIKAAGGDAPWLTAALDALAQVSEGRELLLASPLGLFASVAAAPAGDETQALAPRDVHPARPVRQYAEHAGQPLLVLVDGGGSSLLLRNELVRIGHVGTTAAIDVAMPADLQSHHADIIRQGDNYFLTAYGPVTVNRRRVEHTLLHDGDRIVLGTKGKITFAQPSAKSGTAVLRLSHRCRLAQDVSDVILFRDTCIIGPDASCHIRTRGVDGRVVVFDRNGELHARQTAGEHFLSNNVQTVQLGQTLEFGDLRLTAKSYRADHSGMQA